MDDFKGNVELTIAVLGLISTIFGGFAVTLRMLKRYISTPFENALKDLTDTIQDLREDLNESRSDRKEKETHLFRISDEHTRQISDINGRVKTLEIITKLDVDE